MKICLKRICTVLFVVICVSVLTGCTNWEQAYMDQNMILKNVEGRLELCEGSFENIDAERHQLRDRLKQSLQTIIDLERQIGAGVPVGEATGFGKGAKYDKAAGTITVTLQNTVLFSSGKATLKKMTISELDHIKSVIKARYSGMLIDVVGHTDSDPIKKSKWKDNWQLSAERALAVLRYLNSRGISSSNIRAVASGSSVPIAKNTTISGKARNRRVEIVVHTR